jgi:DNA-binding LacI/PurR family transcriptional regulator
MRTNIKDIAEKTGFSVATVSRVMNNKGPVRDDTRRRVLKIAEELNYKPHPFARGLSRKLTDTIGVILPELNDEYFMDIIHGIDEEAHRNKRYLMVSSSHSERNDMETIIEFMSSGRVDGVILMAPSMQQDIYNILSKSRRPVVLLNSAPQLNGIVSFSVDNFRGAFLITEHLIGHDYKRIGMIKGPEQNIEAKERFLGFTKALSENNIVYNPDLVISGDFSTRTGYYGFLRLMGQPNRPEAIFMANDMMALGAYEAARISNIRIPEDIAIVGFDDIFSGRIVTPRLTTIHSPINELGGQAMKYLLMMINREVDPGASFQKVLSPALVIGESCGCHAKTFNTTII